MSDLIDRQETIKYLMTNMDWYDEDGYESDEDYKRECITELINGVPSAQLERKNGEWIPEFDGKFTGGRKAGFGKTGTWELETDNSGLSEIAGYTTKYVSVYVDRIEEYVEE